MASVTSTLLSPSVFSSKMWAKQCQPLLGSLNEITCETKSSTAIYIDQGHVSPHTMSVSGRVVSDLHRAR